MEKLGLGYDIISGLNPSVIMLSSGAFGRTGPMKNSRGLHSAVNLFSGVADVTAYLDGAPRILGGVLPDPLSGTFSNFAILAALHHRGRTGQGQFIDVAMYEAMLTLIPEAVINLTVNGNEPQRAGNRDPQSAPHGIYRCRDDDTWIAVSVASGTAWAAVCRVAGRSDWASDPRFIDTERRCANVAALDLAVEEWTRTVNVHDATELLQSAGVAAGPVLRVDELLDNDQLQARGAVVTVDHPVVGPRRQLGSLANGQLCRSIPGRAAARRTDPRYPDGAARHRRSRICPPRGRRRPLIASATWILHLPAEEAGFKAEVRDFLQRELTPDVFRAHRDQTEQGMWTAEFTKTFRRKLRRRRLYRDGLAQGVWRRRTQPHLSGHPVGRDGISSRARN